MVVVCLSIVVNAATSAETASKQGPDENLRVLSGSINGVSAGKMMNHYLLDEAGRRFEDWKTQYEQRTTPEQIAEYQKRLRSKQGRESHLREPAELLCQRGVVFA